MSYEGRTAFICENGHIYVISAYDDEPSICEYCNTLFRRVGSIDDTNNCAESNFRFRIMKRGSRTDVIKDGARVITVIPNTYKIERKPNKIYNFDTGEILGELEDD